MRKFVVEPGSWTPKKLGDWMTEVRTSWGGMAGHICYPSYVHGLRSSGVDGAVAVAAIRG